MTRTSFIQQLPTKKSQLQHFLTEILVKNQSQFQTFDLADQIFPRLVSFCNNGKMMRGSLFLSAYELFSKSLPAAQRLSEIDQWRVATSLEFIHSGLLIHDDIIDRDTQRRGADSIWQQFRIIAKKKAFRQPAWYGQSLAICIANICYGLGQNLLTQIELTSQSKNQLIQFFNSEIINVNFAEMLDEKLALQKTEPQLEEILQMYLYKTARYTFTLPILLAAQLSCFSDQETQLLETITENLGLIFQIKDDEIGLFAAQEVSGKVAGSDIKEGKRSFYYFSLCQELRAAQQTALLKRFHKLYGHPSISTEQSNWCRDLFQHWAQPAVQRYLDTLTQQVEKQLLQLAPSHQSFFRELLEYNLKRLY